MHVMT